MFRKPFLVLMMSAAATGLVMAGCGSSSSHTTPAASSSAGSTTGGASSTTSSTAASSSSGSGSSSSNPAVVQAVAACKASINSAAQLPAADKTKLTGLCDKAANGDVAGVKKIAAEVCKDIVNASVPSSAPSSIKDQALAACKKA
jgi:ABC-type phosphate transport system substrate-binding protein